MDGLINGRTPEEIKRVLEWAVCACGSMVCEECQYYKSVCSHENLERIAPDALALIQHLESERDAALAKVPKWISVEERLPENEKDVLIFGWRDGIGGKLWPVVMTAFHMDGKVLAQDSSYAWSEGSIEMEYDEDADDFIVPEGWFEDVQCADEFSMVYDIRVTHWMPKPQPPEEYE